MCDQIAWLRKPPNNWKGVAKNIAAFVGCVMNESALIGSIMLSTHEKERTVIFINFIEYYNVMHPQCILDIP